MSTVPTIVAVGLVLFNIVVAILFTRSSDWRDCALGWAVLIVYISIGAYHAYRLAKRTKPC
jgi:hypothetical protein